MTTERCADCGQFVGAKAAGYSTMRRNAPGRKAWCEACVSAMQGIEQDFTRWTKTATPLPETPQTRTILVAAGRSGLDQSKPHGNALAGRGRHET